MWPVSNTTLFGDIDPQGASSPFTAILKLLIHLTTLTISYLGYFYPSGSKSAHLPSYTVDYTSLASLCTKEHFAMLVDGLKDVPAVTYDISSVTTTLVEDYEVSTEGRGSMYPSGSGFDFCKVNLAMSHDNLEDTISLQFYLPSPSTFQNRWLSVGGGGWSVNGGGSQQAGLVYGAASGSTDGGFGSGGGPGGGMGSQLSADLLSPVEGTLEWSRLESFAYQAIHEMTVAGKELTNAFYRLKDGELKAYYQGCSEGGREGHMSVQRYPEDFDGVLAAAPAFYFPVIQLAQGWPNMAMAQIGHWPSPCAFNAILEDTIASCDGLDGLEDGVVTRSELCDYDARESVGKTWKGCSSGGKGAPTSGAVSEKDAEVVNAIYKGPFDSNGNQIFWAYRPATNLAVEAGVRWDPSTQSFGPSGSHFFDDYYQKLVLKTKTPPKVDYRSLTVDYIFELMLQGLQDYGSWTQTTWADLTAFQRNGGKLIHWHGEADTNLFPECSAHYHEKVREAMFPDSEGYEEINEFYRLFMVPGAAHCSINSFEPNGPFPQYGLAQLIDWVEKGVAPEYLNGTTESGSSTIPKVCLWPGRPQWDSEGVMSCVNNGKVPEEFIHPLNGWKVDL